MLFTSNNLYIIISFTSDILILKNVKSFFSLYSHWLEQSNTDNTEASHAGTSYEAEAEVYMFSCQFELILFANYLQIYLNLTYFLLFCVATGETTFRTDDCTAYSCSF